MLERSAWLEWRRSGIGSSDCAAILGVSKWRTQWDVFHEKTTPTPDETDAAKNRGRRLEGAILQWMADELGVASWVPGVGVVGRESWMRGTPDGLGLFADGRPDIGLEAKSSRDKPWEKPTLAYELQCRWLQAVTDTDLWILGAFFVHHDEWRLYRIERDLKIEEALVGKMGAWWTKHIVGNEAPPLQGASARRWLRQQHPEGRGWLAGDADTRLLAHRYQLAAKAEREAKARKDEAGLHLRQVIGEHQGIDGEGWSVKWSRFERRSIDTDGLVAAHPEVADLVEEFTTRQPQGRLYTKEE